MGKQQGSFKLGFLDICLFQSLNSGIENYFGLHVIKAEILFLKYRGVRLGFFLK
jgi:hypothetical protein